MQTMKAVVGRMSRNPLLVTGLSIVIIYVLIGLLAPVLAPPAPDSDPLQTLRDLELNQLTPNPTPPSSLHIFGTTDGQYDVYYGCIWGTQTAFRLGILSMLGALAMGLLFGTLAGYFGGFVDEALSWIINIFLALSPILGLSIILGMPTKTQFLWTSIEVVLSRTDKLTVALILIGWPICANIIRSEVFRIRHGTHSEEPEAIKVDRRQAWKTYLTQVLYAACLQLGSAVLFGAGISFLGLGSGPDYADWGGLIQRARVWISQPTSLLESWHIYVFPGLFLITFVLGWILLGEGFSRIIERNREKTVDSCS